MDNLLGYRCVSAMFRGTDQNEDASYRFHVEMVEKQGARSLFVGLRKFVSSLTLSFFYFGLVHPRPIECELILLQFTKDRAL